MNTKRFVLALGLALLAGACAPVTSYTEAEAPKNLKIDSTTMQVDVRFFPGSAALMAADAVRLNRAAATGEIAPSDRVTVAAAGPPYLARQREGSVSALLLHYGIVTVAGEDRLLPDHAVVAVMRTLVTLPPCPNWSKRPYSEFENQPSSNFGCATQTNLGMMVADPADLARGLPLGPAAGEPAAAAVNRYLRDKVELPGAAAASPFSASASGGTTGNTPPANGSQ